MNKILIGTIALAMISNCSNTSEVKPKIVEKLQPTPQVVQPVLTLKAEVKKENLFEVAKQSCLAKNAQGCIDFGLIMTKQEDYKMAKTAFHLAYDYGDKDGGMEGNYYVECLEKNAKSCHMLGYYAEEGKGGNPNYKLAREFYQKAIDLGDTDSLGSLAHLYDKGQGGEKNHFKATKLFEKSCNTGTTDVNYENCFNVGNHYYFGKGVKQDYFKSFEYYKKSCNSVYAYGCDAIGLAYYNGKGVKQSDSMAKKYFGKACDGKVEEGCTHYAKLNLIVKKGTSQSQRAYSSSSYAPKGTSNVIESKIDGDFEGWEGETVVKLMNGQVWQQSSYHYHYHYAYMPEVLIYKSGGAYKMKVDGVDTDVNVIRLK